MQCSNYSSCQLSSTRHACYFLLATWFHVIRGRRETYWWGMGGADVPQKSLVMWPDEHRCTAGAGCWPTLIYHAVCFVFTYSVFPPFYLPSIHKMFWHVEIHTTLPRPPSGPPLPATHSSSLRLYFTNTRHVLLEPFSTNFLSYTYNVIMFSFAFIDFSFLCNPCHPPSHSLMCGVNFHYTPFQV